MIMDSGLFFEINSTIKEDGVIENNCWVSLASTDKEAIRLKYDNMNSSRVYSNLCIADIFDHYIDSYGIKIFKLFEVLGFQSNSEVFKGLKFEVFDLLEFDYGVGDLREILNIMVNVVTLNGKEIGYLIKDYECGEDDLANFYFLDEEAARRYLKTYFDMGLCLLEMKDTSKKKFIDAGQPKPFDIDIILDYYSSIEDLLFGGSIKVCEFKTIKESQNELCSN